MIDEYLRILKEKEDQIIRDLMISSSVSIREHYNIYDNPEKFDFKIIAVEDPSGNYEFDTHVALQHSNGSVYYMHDAGCSCPHPFDGTALSDLELVTLDCFDSFKSAIDESMKASGSSIEDRFNFFKAIEFALKQAKETYDADSRSSQSPLSGADPQ